FDNNNGQLVRRNDFAFLQPVEPVSANNSISRQHAKIEFINGEFYLFDIGSTNGSAINRRERGRPRLQIKLHQNNPQGVMLRDRDIIQLGLALLSFEIVPQEDIQSIIEQLSDNHDMMPAPGSTADVFRTAAITTSLTSALVW